MIPLELANIYRQVRAGSDDERALLASGFELVEHDEKHAILRRARRAGDYVATVDDLRRYREIEHEVFAGIAGEGQAAGYTFESDRLRWVVEEFRQRMAQRIGDRR